MKVQILLSTYNGEKYLKELIESLKRQAGVEFSILVRDDGSSDNTPALLREYQTAGVLSWYAGENIRPAYSFLDLMKKASDADYYAFCDQDDVWHENKLVRAVSILEDKNNGQPALYFSKAQLVDEQLSPIKYNQYPKQVYTFGQALIKNNATGCTVVFNKKLLNIVNEYTPGFVDMHDHWVYLVCLALEGKVVYDEESFIQYRQHSNNVVGGRNDFFKNLKNKAKILISKEKSRKRIAIELLTGYETLLCNKHKEMLKKIKNYENSFVNKLQLLADRDIKNHHVIYDIFFFIAVVCNAF